MVWQASSSSRNLRVELLSIFNDPHGTGPQPSDLGLSTTLAPSTTNSLYALISCALSTVTHPPTQNRNILATRAAVRPAVRDDGGRPARHGAGCPRGDFRNCVPFRAARMRVPARVRASVRAARRGGAPTRGSAARRTDTFHPRHAGVSYRTHDGGPPPRRRRVPPCLRPEPTFTPGARHIRASGDVVDGLSLGPRLEPCLAAACPPAHRSRNQQRISGRRGKVLRTQHSRDTVDIFCRRATFLSASSTSLSHHHTELTTLARPKKVFSRNPSPCTHAPSRCSTHYLPVRRPDALSVSFSRSQALRCRRTSGSAYAPSSRLWTALRPPCRPSRRTPARASSRTAASRVSTTGSARASPQSQRRAPSPRRSAASPRPSTCSCTPWSRYVPLSGVRACDALIRGQIYVREVQQCFGSGNESPSLHLRELAMLGLAMQRLVSVFPYVTEKRPADT